MYNGVTVVKIQKNSIISWKRILPLVASPSPHSLGTCWYFSLSIVLPFMWVFPPYFNYINVPFGPSLVDTFRGRRKIPSLWPAMNEVTWAKPLLICLERWRMLGFRVEEAGQASVEALLPEKFIPHERRQEHAQPAHFWLLFLGSRVLTSDFFVD